MHARHRSALILGLIILVLFIARWPLDNSTCNPNTWKDPVSGKSWRPNPAEGSSFFSTIFKGGGGTPAIFAMLGGQRYMVANILWNYTDVLFHKGKIYDMVLPYESTVTLNSSFTEAWSTYGWHLAWNLYSDTSDIVQKEKWLEHGKSVFIRAIVANPKKPKHRYDLSELYINREGNYRKALNVLEPVIYPTDGYQFKPLTEALKKDTTNLDVIDECFWDPIVGRQLAIVYLKLGFYTGDWKYFEKSVKVYQLILRDNPDVKGVQETMKRLQGHLKKRDMTWFKQGQEEEMRIRHNYMFQEVHPGDSLAKMFPIDNGSTGIPGDKPRY